MCTAISWKKTDHYFGRNLDLEYSYHETVTVCPRNFVFRFRNGTVRKQNYAMIGMAYVQNQYPLFYEATNEKGLSMAGLHFVGNAYYPEVEDLKKSVAPFELIPWVLSQCETCDDAERLLKGMQICQMDFSKTLKSSPLHWMISDAERSLVVEPLKDGLHLMNHPLGVLTNNPPLEYHLLHLSEFLNVTREEVESRFSERFSLQPFSRGMGTIGLPGDLSSSSRFVRAAFTKWNSECEDNENSRVGQFFHMLSSVEQVKGCCQFHGKYEYTIYSSCCNTTQGIYYYRTYDQSQIVAVHLHHCPLDSEELVVFPLRNEQNIYHEN